ncbi:hypothetical protein AVEN_159242-1 [Araneus ventricosus]|uniref:Uncharacterized protein n=1 Tax=Araneus ventricosus TaxID=182803 RepID=A0A4Y2A1K0_ARAVE|nr:hypothetical protein AVEN_159242-1 [Araneus ventricosus]
MRVGTAAVPDTGEDFTPRIQRSSSGLSPRSLKLSEIHGLKFLPIFFLVFDGEVLDGRPWAPPKSDIFLNEETDLQPRIRNLPWNIWTLKAVDLARRPSGQGDSRDDRPISVPFASPKLLADFLDRWTDNSIN